MHFVTSNLTLSPGFPYICGPYNQDALPCIGVKKYLLVHILTLKPLCLVQFVYPPPSLSLSVCPAGPINTKANDSGFVGQTEQKGGRAASRSSLHHNGARNFDMAVTFSTLNMSVFWT